MRLKHLISRIISPEQGVFVIGKETMEVALVAHEVLDLVDFYYLPTFIIKLDMMKVYDKLNWEFLFKVLKKIGFV